MNLSSYLQMPPAPLAPNSTSPSAPQGPRTGVGPSAGGSLGFDFAQVMARQMATLVPQERQTFAADVPQQPETPVQTQDSRPAEDRQRADQTDRDATRATRTDQEASDDASNDQSATHARQRSKAAAQKPQRADVDDLLEGLMQGAPVTPVVGATPLTTVDAKLAATELGEAAAATPNFANATALQTVQLSPQMRIITDPQKAPSPESLAAFAKSMGLDESAIQNLLAQEPATPATTLAGTSTSSLSVGLPATSPTALQAAMGSALQGMNQGSNTDSAAATQLVAMATTAAQPLAASGAGLAAPATTLAAPAIAGLAPSDMAAIQQLQITVLPAAVLPVNTTATSAPAPSTLDMLSLLGTGIDEKDVGALLSRFNEDASNDANSEQPSSQDENNHFSGFAQAPNNTKVAANATPTNAAQASATHMTEVYDQLSDKMATEMAARMHKQLSDGEWKMKFALRPSNLGGVEIQLEMKDGKLDAVFRADNPLTRDLLQNSSQRLRDALGNFGINAGQVNVGQGGGNTSQNGSGQTGKQPQVRDNSTSQVNGTSSASGASSTRSKANASLLDLYA